MKLFRGILIVFLQNWDCSHSLHLNRQTSWPVFYPAQVRGCWYATVEQEKLGSTRLYEWGCYALPRFCYRAWIHHNCWVQALPPATHLPALENTLHHPSPTPIDSCTGQDWPVQLTRLHGPQQCREAGATSCTSLPSPLGVADVLYGMSYTLSWCKWLVLAQMKGKDCTQKYILLSAQWSRPWTWFTFER